MRRIVLAGVVALAALVGSVVPAAAATTPAKSAKQAGGVFAAVSIAGSLISCGSAKTCLAVGSKFNDSADTSAPIAEAWNGTKWRSVHVPAPKGSTLTVLTGVSCKSATSCVVVGSYDTAGEDGSELPFALTWNGSSLRLTAALPAPKGGSLVSFNGVSCATAKHCVAVGTSIAEGVNEGSSAQFVVETWNGAKWSLRTVRGSSSVAFADVDAVSCPSTSSCVVAGESFSLTGKQTMLLAKWNGKAFAAMKAAVPADDKAAPLLDDVSCVSATSCVATGVSTNSAGTSGFGFTEGWNGKTWTVRKVAVPKGDTLSYPIGVSCVTSRNCVAVGAAGSSKGGGASALSYNGKTWSAMKIPAPGKGKSTDFTGVSCPKAGDCVAIGQSGASGGTTFSQLGGVWNGSTWRLVTA